MTWLPAESEMKQLTIREWGQGVGETDPQRWLWGREVDVVQRRALGLLGTLWVWKQVRLPAGVWHVAAARMSPRALLIRWPQGSPQGREPAVPPFGSGHIGDGREGTLCDFRARP